MVWRAEKNDSTSRPLDHSEMTRRQSRYDQGLYQPLASCYVTIAKDISHLLDDNPSEGVTNEDDRPILLLICIPGSSQCQKKLLAAITDVSLRRRSDVVRSISECKYSAIWDIARQELLKPDDRFIRCRLAFWSKYRPLLRSFAHPCPIGMCRKTVNGDNAESFRQTARMSKADEADERLTRRKWIALCWVDTIL